MKTTPCPHCGKPIHPAAILGAVGGSVTSPAKTQAARANGRAGGGRPIGSKDSKPRKPVFFACNRHHNTAVLLEGFRYWEEVQGAFRCGIMLPDGTSANGIGRCASVAEFHRKAAAGKTRVLATSNETPPAQGKGAQ